MHEMRKIMDGVVLNTNPDNSASADAQQEQEPDGIQIEPTESANGQPQFISQQDKDRVCEIASDKVRFDTYMGQLFGQ